MSYQKKRVNSPYFAYNVSDCAIFSKSLAIAQNGSVAAFFFFPLIQFTDSVKNSTFGLDKKIFLRMCRSD